MTASASEDAAKEMEKRGKERRTKELLPPNDAGVSQKDASLLLLKACSVSLLSFSLVSLSPAHTGSDSRRRHVSSPTARDASETQEKLVEFLKEMRSQKLHEINDSPM